MKKDIALVCVVVIISLIFSVIISNVIFVPPKNRQQTVEIVQPISGSFPLPDKRYFNPQSIDPTKLITIGNNTNTVPFNSPSQ